MYHNGKWGTVCDNGWDLNDAQVVCKELGYGSATNATVNAFYGRGSGPIWLSNLKCVGTEWTIGNCSHSGWGVYYYYDCSRYHRDDAGVKCNSGKLSLHACTYHT